MPVIYYVLLFASTLLGIYDTPAKCERALQAELKSHPSEQATLVCEKREID